MTIRETISYLVSHLAPTTLVKQIFPVINVTDAYSHTSHQSKPWVNVGEVKLTAEDFA